MPERNITGSGTGTISRIAWETTKVDLAKLSAGQLALWTVTGDYNLASNFTVREGGAFTPTLLRYLTLKTDLSRDIIEEYVLRVKAIL